METIKTPKIEAIRHWSPDSVRSACIRNELYTRGNNAAYSRMLNYVGVAAGGPTLGNLYLVAKDIWEHSENQTITNIMYILENEVVITTYEIDGSDEI